MNIHQGNTPSTVNEPHTRISLLQQEERKNLSPELEYQNTERGVEVIARRKFIIYVLKLKYIMKERGQQNDK